MTSNTLTERLAQAVPELTFHADHPLAPHTYFKIGGAAEAYCETADSRAVCHLLEYCARAEIRVTLLGGGSNVLVSDKGVRGLVLKLTSNSVVDTGKKLGEHHLIHADAGTKTALLVSRTVALGFTGLEYFLGVPGNLGGAVYNNAHYLQELIGSHIHRVEVVNKRGERVWVAQQDCEFAYEFSRFQRTKEAILTVEFALLAGDPDRSREQIRTATEYRARTQPLGPPSSGCIFQNVPNTDVLREQFPEFADAPYIPGGFLIDQAGLKGARIGGVEVSSKHAAWLINTGSATAADAKALIAKIKSQVQDRFGVQLREEVFYLE